MSKQQQRWVPLESNPEVSNYTTIRFSFVVHNAEFDQIRLFQVMNKVSHGEILLISASYALLK